MDFCSNVDICKGIINLGGVININPILLCNEFTMVDDEGVNLTVDVIDCSLDFIILQFLLIGGCVKEVV
jgi:hypothetical protein